MPGDWSSVPIRTPDRAQPHTRRILLVNLATFMRREHGAFIAALDQLTSTQTKCSGKRGGSRSCIRKPNSTNTWPKFETTSVVGVSKSRLARPRALRRASDAALSCTWPTSLRSATPHEARRWNLTSPGFTRMSVRIAQIARPCSVPVRSITCSCWRSKPLKPSTSERPAITLDRDDEVERNLDAAVHAVGSSLVEQRISKWRSGHARKVSKGGLSFPPSRYCARTQEKQLTPSIHAAVWFRNRPLARSQRANSACVEQLREGPEPFAGPRRRPNRSLSSGICRGTI